MLEHMKITPIEIRQKTFEKNFRGYDKEEVQAFLLMLSQEWEDMIEELRRYKLKLENAEKELQRIREVEDSLFKTLKTAEDTGSTLIEQAKKAADLKIKEAQIQAEKILNDARAQARSIVGRAEERARQLRQETLAELKQMEAEYRALENHRDNLILEMKTLLNSMQEKLLRAEEKKGTAKERIAARLSEMENILEEQRLRMESKANTYDDKPNEIDPSSFTLSDEDDVSEKNHKKNPPASFFDEI
jgi:cell division initiation protein